MIVYINGIKTYYEASGEGRPVILLHGWGADSSSMRSILTLVRDRLPGRAYALDFPGFGYSDPPGADWSVSDYLTFLKCFLDTLQLTRVDIIAHSFGGRVAIKFAAAYPEQTDRLVLVDSAGIRPERTLKYRLRVAFAKTLKWSLSKAPGLAKSLRLDQLAYKQGSPDYQKAGPLRRTFVKVVNEDLQPYLSKIQSPTLLMWGDRDTSTPLADGRRMQALIPGAHLEILHGAGHFSYLDRFNDFSRVVIPFLTGTNQ